MQTFERRRRCAAQDLEIGNAKRGGVSRDACGARLVALDRDGAIGGVGEHPFDRDGARAGADIPETFALPRRERCKRDGAHVALGELSVMLEPFVGEPGVNGITRATGSAMSSTATALSGDMSCSANSAAAEERIRSREPPRFSSTCMTERPKPRAARCVARRAAVVSSQESAMTRLPGCRCGVTRSRARPCSDRSAQSCWLQARRAATSAKVDGAGRQKISSRAICSASVAPTPKKNGSPEASTTVGAPRHSSTCATPSEKGEGQGRCAARVGPISARCRAPPNMTVASSMIARATEDNAPSSPRPMIVSQRPVTGRAATYRRRAARLAAR